MMAFSFGQFAVACGLMDGTHPGAGSFEEFFI